ncbi:hypothetical protein [Solibacillus isronensis]|uniref:hypothetical protein n=1 Tax=Solibacillus isronensis TaxID=412383 RepID=UPI0039A26EFA
MQVGIVQNETESHYIILLKDSSTPLEVSKTDCEEVKLTKFQHSAIKKKGISGEYFKWLWIEQTVGNQYRLNKLKGA